MLLDLLKDIVKIFAKTLGIYAIGFGFGTLAGAGICLYYGAPLVLSLIGGAAVVGLALAVTLNSSWW
ncbi:MAG: hypothetical protein AAFX45_02945 [Pseudomonadota bacterium]